MFPIGEIRQISPEPDSSRDISKKNYLIQNAVAHILEASLQLLPFLQKENLNFSQYLLLSYLVQEGVPLKVGDIQKVMGHSFMSVTGDILNRLEKKGLIKRGRDSINRRTVLVTVTGKGRDMLNRIRTEIIRYIDTDTAEET